METVTINIGNSDNKLIQQQWSDFVEKTREVVKKYCHEIHFDGGSKHDAPWQNACFVAVVEQQQKQSLCDDLGNVREEFFQNSTAVTFGQTLFV